MTVRAVFLDRDGVINKVVLREGRPYPPASLQDLEIIGGVPEALQDLRSGGFKLIVVTNQPDVGRGRTPLKVVEQINDHLLMNLTLDGIRACYHSGAEDCDCRKPKPGMLFAAAHDLGIDLAASFMVGDRWRDMDAGAAAGCRTILIDGNYDERSPMASPAYICRTLSEAARWILVASGEQQ